VSVDPDVDLGAEARHGEAAVLAVVCVGGVLGALARYGAGRWWPTTPGQFPWTTLWINIVGCALMGVLMVVVADVLRPRRLVQPFLATGVLGGFTTFSTYALDTRALSVGGHAGRALTYLAATIVGALVAVSATAWLTRRVLGRARR
jgi:fluoride exporter